MLRNAIPFSTALLAGTILTSFAAPAMAADDAKCAALAAKVVGNAKVDLAEAVPAGSFKPPEGQAQANLPAFCRVRATSKPTPRSNIQFEVWMPASGWTGRIDMVGNHGNSGGIYFGEMATLIRAGNAAVGTDTGHTGSGEDYAFGDNNDDAVLDWTNRSLHESIVASKVMVADYYGKPAQYSYFLGCSTGGHQALTEAVRHPDDFDGILAGAAANNRTNLNLHFLSRFLLSHPQGDNSKMIISAKELQTVGRAALEQCDALDGVRDGILAHPPACKFDVASLSCAKNKSDDCLSDEQVKAVQGIYGDTKRRDNGEVIYTGFPFGSEAVSGTRQGWHAYFAEANDPQYPKRGGYFAKWVFKDPKWDWWKFDWAKDVDAARKRMAPLTDMTDTNMSAFHKSGGKLIMYAGWSDPVVSAIDTTKYYEGVTKTNPNAADFSRFYQVPGLGHCDGGPGTTSITFNMNAPADHDMTVALHTWVEKGTAPDRIIGTKYKEEDKPESGVAMTRPVCPWPKVQTYSGKGDTNDASNFQCR